MPLCACCARVFHLWRLQDQQFLLSRRFIPLVYLLNSTNWPKINSVYKQCHRSRKTKIRQIENKNPTALNLFHVQLIPHPLFPPINPPDSEDSSRELLRKHPHRFHKFAPRAMDVLSAETSYDSDLTFSSSCLLLPLAGVPTLPTLSDRLGNKSSRLSLRLFACGRRDRGSGRQEEFADPSWGIIIHEVSLVILMSQTKVVNDLLLKKSDLVFED